MPSLKFVPGNVKGNLFFEPMDTIVQPGSPVDLTVVLNNQSFRDIEGFDFTVLYDDEVLQLESWDLSPLTTALGLEREHSSSLRGLESTSIIPPGGSGAELQVENEKSSLHLAARLANATGEERMTLARLRFAALPQPSGQTSVRFARPPETTAAVYARGENILGTDDRMISGLLNANLFIRDASLLAQDEDATETLDLETALPHEMPEENRSIYGWSIEPPKSLREAKVEIRLQAPEVPEVQTGEAFWVDLVLINDDRALVHGIGAAVRFDPTKLEVVDQDRGNWIHRGVNVWDGGFHEDYPFDFHAENHVDNKTGLIVYHGARHYREYAFPSGVFARIRFRALAPSDATSVRVVRNVHEGRPGTFVRAYGLDLLDNTWDPARPPQVALRVLETETGEPGPLASSR